MYWNENGELVLGIHANPPKNKAGGGNGHTYAVGAIAVIASH